MILAPIGTKMAYSLPDGPKTQCSDSSGGKAGFPDNERILLGLSGGKAGFPDNERILLGLSGGKAGFPDNELRQQKKPPENPTAFY